MTDFPDQNDQDDDFDADADDAEETYPPLADFLSPWFAEQAARLSGLRRTRVVHAADRFYRCLEAEADRIATDGERAMLAMERQFAPHGAASRVMPMDALPDALRAFISPRWMPENQQDQRVQLQLVAQLCDQLLRTRPGDEQWSTCSVLDLRCEIDRLRQSPQPTEVGAPIRSGSSS
jgi:hypothetical protein